MGKKLSQASSPWGMVATASSAATKAGVRMLEMGGNAVDAAVAAAFCLGVTEPQASGLGGQSMVLLHLARENKTIALDGSSRAPFALNPKNVPSEPLKLGICSTTVPSTPAVLGYLLDRYGTLPLERVLEPAIQAAQEGFKLTALQHSLLVREKEKLLEDPLVSKNYFKSGRALKAGEILQQPELANCLKQMVRAGWQDFYHGEIAATLVKDMENRGGMISQVDLSQIPIPVERPVLKSSYRQLKLATFPPPGAGRALIQILNILENFSPPELKPGSPGAALILALAFRVALRDRERMPVDPELYWQSQEKRMVDKEYAQTITQRIREIVDRCGLPQGESDWEPPPTAGETTHLSVADQEGNLIGITQSIELVFGSKTMAQGLGFFYNNYMSAYEYKDITHPYYLLPGARPWSSVAPTIIFQEQKPWLVLGSPGSLRIATSLAQVITRIVDGGEELAAAVDGPRLHADSRLKVQIEQERFPPETMELLHQAGFKITKRSPYSFYLGCIQAVQVPGPGGDRFEGVADPRRDGSAQGPVGELNT